MDYKKKYEEALSKAKSFELPEYKNIMASIFPELAESEDEKIRNALIRFHKSTIDIDGIEGADILAWLEKQGEQKPIMNVPTREVILSIWDLGNEWKELTNGSISTEYGTQLDYIQKHWYESEYYLREKQGEQKSVLDFKASNWYVSKVDGKIHDMTYNSTDKVEPFDKYEGLTDFERTLADICIGWIGEELGWKQYIKDNADVLLKIAIKKFNSIQDAPFKQKSAAWSEEDEEMTYDVIKGCVSAEKAHHFIHTPKEVADWLKSLKDRIGG